MKRTNERTGESNCGDVSADRDSGCAQENGINGHADPKSTTNGAGAFQEFWAQYPKKVEKLAAQKIFARLVKGGVDPQDIIRGAMRYAAERAAQDPRFTKHPTTWLNHGCWADEPSPPARPPRRAAVEALLRMGGNNG